MSMSARTFCLPVAIAAKARASKHPSNRPAPSAMPSFSAPVVPRGVAGCKKTLAAHGKPQGRALRSYSGPVMHGEDGESEDARRERESREVQDRIQYISNLDEFHSALAKAGDNVVVLEVMSDTQCALSDAVEVAEIQYRVERPTAEQVMMPCVDMKSSLQRTARDCQDATFLACYGDADAASSALCDAIGITCFPTLQFYKNGNLLWEQRGAAGAEENLGSGLLYYGATYLNQGAEHASDFVKELGSLEDIDSFCAQSREELVVVDISTRMCEPCIKVFPAVMALAKSMGGFAAFGRLIIDDIPSGNGQLVLDKFNIIDVPTFLFFHRGQLVNKYVGSSRGDLIGQILTIANNVGMQPPPPPPSATPRPTTTTPGGRVWTR